MKVRYELDYSPNGGHVVSLYEFKDHEPGEIGGCDILITVSVEEWIFTDDGDSHPLLRVRYAVGRGDLNLLHDVRDALRADHLTTEFDSVDEIEGTVSMIYEANAKTVAGAIIEALENR